MKKRAVSWLLMLAMLIAFMPTNLAQAATYQKGAYGVQVQILQQNLTFLGFTTNGIDGSYGNNTRSAVIALQKKLGFPQTGAVDEELNQLIQNTVADIQRYMQVKKFYTGTLDGVAGGATKKAYMQLQKSWGEYSSGTVNLTQLLYMVLDPSEKVQMKSLKEWVARLQGTYEENPGTYYSELLGEQYWKLFEQYPQCLAMADTTLTNIFKSSTAYLTFTNEISDIDEDIWKTVIADGFSYAMDGMLSWFGISANKEEQIRQDAIMTMVLDLYQDKSTSQKIVGEIEEAFSDMDKIYSIAETGAKYVLIEELAKSCTALSYETIEEIVNSALDEHLSGITKFLDGGATVVDYLITTMQLYQLDGELLDKLQEVAGNGTAIYEDIELIKKAREENPALYFEKQFFSDAAKKIVGAAISKATGGLYDIITSSVDMLDGLLGNASVQEQATAARMCVYFTELNAKLGRIREDLRKNIIYYTDAEIVNLMKDYEFAFIAGSSAASTFYDSVASMTSNKVADQINNEKENLKLLTYESGMKICFGTMDSLKSVATTSVVQKMDQLFDLVGNKYFTTTQKACLNARESDHKNCAKCKVSNIVNADWFVKTFGKVQYTNFPRQHYDENRTNNDGWSCYGFTLFAQYYVYATDNTQKLVAEKVASGKYSKDFAKKYIQPGDVIRLTNTHSGLVYAVEDDGVVIIDSNGDMNKLNCLVEKRKITYSGYYNGKNVIVDRVVNATNSASSTTKPVITISPTPTVSPTPTPTPTVTPTPTATPTPTPTVTVTPTPVPVVSGWMKASECPAGVTIVDTKWTYTYTERTESENAVLDGWIRDGERKEIVASGTFEYATFPDTFNTSHAVYTGMYANKDAIPVADSTKREILSDTPAGYVYWHYSYPIGGGGEAGNRIVGYYHNQNLKSVGSWCYATEFCAFKSTKNYTATANNKEGGGTVYKITDSDYMKYDVAKGSYWWYRFEYKTCTYQDVKTVYQYYRILNKESMAEVYDGNGISNVEKWVKYQ